ncbi:YnjH family protein [Vibrio sp. Vb2880]|uniref:YnjH family protein n=1 Tax=Vibrio sp. Vb2880 TaxID=2816076 RepID=UPI001A9042CE|nr:YnjH family protein [Vibrio sp. Vb2880]MBO0214051.1 YnjH family protein [Vibrio sp. Vb2880]
MIKPLSVWAAMALTASAHAASMHTNTVSTSNQHNMLMDGNLGKRVCYYDDKAYSEGSVLQIGAVYMICQRANDFETNGPLKWVLLQQEQPKTP